MKNNFGLLLIFVLVSYGCSSSDLEGIDDPDAKQIFNKKLENLDCLPTNTKIIEKGDPIDDIIYITGISWDYPCEYSNRNDFFTKEDTKNRKFICLTFRMNSSSGKKADGYAYLRKCSLNLFNKLDIDNLEIKNQINLINI